MKKLFYPLALATLLVTSCDVEIPETDDISPEFTFSIKNESSDNTNNNFVITDKTPNAVLNIKPKDVHKFTFSTTDLGGVKSSNIAISKDSTLVVEILTSKWEKTETATHTNYLLENTDPENAKNMTIGLGGFSSIELLKDTEYNVTLTATDFGGKQGNSNTTTTNFKIKVSNSNTETSCTGCDTEKTKEDN